MEASSGRLRERGGEEDANEAQAEAGNGEEQDAGEHEKSVPADEGQGICVVRLETVQHED